MSSRKISQKEEDDEEHEPFIQNDSKRSKPERPMRGGVFGKCCNIIFRMKYIIAAFLLLFALFLFTIGSFRVSNVEEIMLHPGSFKQYWEHFEYSIGAIAQDSGAFDSLSAAHPQYYSKQEKVKLDIANNPAHYVWGSVKHGQPACVKMNESYLVMVLNTPNVITENMDSFVKMSTEKNHFIISHTHDFLPANPTTPRDISIKEKTMTAYFSEFRHKTASVAPFPYLDFEKFQLSQPVYIGTIRDPIARLQSHFETQGGGHDSTRITSKNFQDCMRAFIRNNVSSEHLVFGTDAEQLGSLALPHEVKSKILKIAEKHKCLSSKYLNVQVKAYCGLDCDLLRRETAEKSVALAVEHMNERFRVILVAEQLLSSVKLLEHVVPDFFTGLSVKAAPMLRMFSMNTASPTPAPTPQPTPLPTPSPVQERLPPRPCSGAEAYCACEGTIYYGKAYVNGVRYQAGGSGPLMTLDEMITLKYKKKDVSATGGAVCSHRVFGDPLVGFTKQCICDPNKPASATRHLRALKTHKSSASGAVKAKKDENILSPQVQEYLWSVLRYEYRIYAAAKQHLAANIQQCKIA